MVEDLKFDLQERSKMVQLYYICVVVIPSPWLKKILKFDFLKRTRMAQLYYSFVIVIPSPWLENFEIWLSETLQNGLIFTVFWDSNTFTMIEENFEI